MMSGYMLVALICLADEPKVCERYGLGWTTTPEACAAAAKATKLRPPKGYIIKLTTCQSGFTPDGRDTL